MPCLIRDVEQREAGKLGSQEAGKKKKPFGLVLNACGGTEGSWEAWKIGSWEKLKKMKNWTIIKIP